MGCSYLDQYTTRESPADLDDYLECWGVDRKYLDERLRSCLKQASKKSCRIRSIRIDLTSVEGYVDEKADLAVLKENKLRIINLEPSFKHMIPQIETEILKEKEYLKKIDCLVEEAANRFSEKGKKAAEKMLRKYYRLIAEGVEQYPYVIEDNLTVIARIGRYISSHLKRHENNEGLLQNSLETIMNKREW